MPLHPPVIVGVSTAVTAFLGRTSQGPVDVATRVTSLSEFSRKFGAVEAAFPLSLSVAQFFTNGGTEGLIVRVENSGAPNEVEQLIGPGLQAAGRGLWALDAATDGNLIVIPPLAPGVDVPVAVWDAAIAYAECRRAIVLVDAPSGWLSAGDAGASVEGFVTRSSHAALYFPRVLVLDPGGSGQVLACAPGGMVAGVYARTDSNRGVWKAPAGSEAALRGAKGLSLVLTDGEQGPLNQAGVNVLREFTGQGRVVWGGRTLLGADGLASEWKYVNVRRLFNFLELSIERGLQWVGSEPNVEVTWAAVRLQVGSFLHKLWQQGAMQGTTPKEGYFVKCGVETMTQEDVENGRLVVLVGVAVLRAGEFVVVRIQAKCAVG